MAISTHAISAAVTGFYFFLFLTCSPEQAPLVLLPLGGRLQPYDLVGPAFFFSFAGRTFGSDGRHLQVWGFRSAGQVQERRVAKTLALREEGGGRGRVVEGKLDFNGGGEG